MVKKNTQYHFKRNEGNVVKNSRQSMSEIQQENSKSCSSLLDDKEFKLFHLSSFVDFNTSFF